MSQKYYFPHCRIFCSSFTTQNQRANNHGGKNLEKKTEDACNQYFTGSNVCLFFPPLQTKFYFFPLQTKFKSLKNVEKKCDPEKKYLTVESVIGKVKTEN